MHKINTYSKGYTLIELLIVLTMIGIMMPAIFSILYVILLQQAKISETITLKNQGDNAQRFMKEQLVGAVAIQDGGISYCTTANSTVSTMSDPDLLERFGTVRFVRRDSTFFRFDYSPVNRSLTYINPPISLGLIDTARVRITDFRFTCNRRSLQSPILVRIQYTIEPANALAQTREGLGDPPRLTYRFGILLLQ